MKPYERREAGNYPGLNVIEFEQLLFKARKIVEAAGPEYYPSPYSIVPVISQLIGLESPMMGTGRSPYSLISIASRLAHRDTFEDEFRYPLAKKRMIVDEIYDMLAPLLLSDTDNYIELLMNTKYRKRSGNNGGLTREATRSELENKMAIMKSFLGGLSFRKGDFAHIAHYGYLEDLYREQSFLRAFDAETFKEWSMKSYPRVVELEISGFDAPHTKITGWLIFVPNTTEELLKDESLRKGKMLQCSLLARNIGARIAGMAGLTASFTRGGFYLSKRVSDLGFTTGHAYTIANITRISKEITKQAGLRLSDCVVAIVGAAGSIGTGTAKLLAEAGVRRFILIEKEGLVTSRKLEILRENIREFGNDIECRITIQTSDIKLANIVIVATSAPEAIFCADDFREGAIIIDDSFPKNVPRDILDEREDIILLEGGITQLPKSLDINMARNVPDFLDVPIIKFMSTKETFACFAETLILAAVGHTGNYGLGEADTGLSKDIMKKASSLNFSLAPLQCFGLPLDSRRLKRVKSIVKRGKRPWQ